MQNMKSKIEPHICLVVYKMTVASRIKRQTSIYSIAKQFSKYFKHMTWLRLNFAETQPEKPVVDGDCTHDAASFL